MANMKMISATQKDEKWQNIMNEIVDWQLKEMQDQKWYPNEIAECKKRLGERTEELRAELNKVDEITTLDINETSIVRKNLMENEFYTPYCGKDNCSQNMPRTDFNPIINQFVCICGWTSKFDNKFIKKYKNKWNK
jgi:hypothetical protein